ncbi:MAG: caspase family protein [Bacteroidales bacterium]|nr:caspase family protein [Bacteroidales bacterium]
MKTWLNKALVIGLFFLWTSASFAQKTIQAHDGAIYHVGFSPDGKTLLMGATNGVAKIWDVSSGQAIRTLAGHTENVVAGAFSPNGKIIATAAEDRWIKTWDASTGVLLNSFGKNPNGGFMSKELTYTGLNFKSNDELVALGNYVLSGYYQINRFNVQYGAKITTIRSDEFFISMDLFPDKKSVVASAANFEGKSWLGIVNLETKEKKILATALDDQYVAVSHDSKYLVSGGKDGKITLFDVASGQKIFEQQIGFSKIKNVVFSDDDRFIVSGSQFDLVVWDKNSGAKLNAFKMTANINDFDANGDLLAVALGDGRIIIYDDLFKQETAELIQATQKTAGQYAFDVLDTEPMIVFERGIHQARVPAVGYTKDGKEIVTASWDKTIRIWNAENGRLKRTIRVPAWKGAEGQIFTMEVSPDKKFIIAAGYSLGIRNQTQTEDYIGDYVLLLDYTTGEVLDAQAAHKQTIQRIAFSSDGSYVVSGGGELDSRVIVFKLDHLKKKLIKFAERDMADASANFYPSCAERNFIAGLCSDQIMSVGFVPGTNEVLSIDILGMLMKQPTNLSSFKLIGESLNRKSAGSLGKISDNAMFRLLEVDPLGKYVAAGDYSGLVTLFELNNTVVKELVKGKSYEKALIHIPSFGQLLMAMAISPKGDKIALAADNKVQVYEINLDGTPKNLSSPFLSFEHKEDVMGLAFSPDGRHLVSTGMNPAECLVWNISSGKKEFQLGENATFELLSAIGTNPKSPTEIGFGRGLVSNPHINNFGRVTKAFDFAKLEITTVKSPYSYSGARELSRGTTAPSVSFPMQEKLRTYLPLGNGHTLIGTNYGSYIDNFTMPISLDGLSIYGLAMSSDKSRFMTGLENGLIRIYTTENGKQEAGLYVSENDDWVLWTPEGYYTASLKGAQSVAWQTNLGATKTPGYYPFEQFDLILNRPDLVLEKLGGVAPEFINALNKAYLKRLRKMDIKEEDLHASLELPTISTDLINKEVSNSKLSVQISASDKTGVKRLFVHINDVSVFGQKGKSISGLTYKDQIPLELTPGINKIQFSVLNSNGVSSLTETRYITLNAPEIKGNLYVVAIGVSDYLDDDFDLNFAAKDATDLVNLLESREEMYDGFTKILITDSEATRENIKAVKNRLLETSVNDEVILFAAGHGLLDDNYNYFFGTSDIDFYNPANKGLAYEDLEDLLDGIPARKKLLLIDACHSGEIDEDELADLENTQGQNPAVSTRGFRKISKTKADKKIGLEKSIDLMSKFFNDLRKGTGAMIISSASGAEFAFESAAWQNGVFTYSLLEGIKSGNADANKDNTFSVSELRDYVSKRVVELTAGKQNPTSRRENLENDFRIW